MKHEDLKIKIRENILESMDFTRDVDDEEMLERIDRGILTECKNIKLALDEKVKLRQELFFSIRKLDVVQLLVDDPEITEIMVNGTDHIFVEKNGRLFRHEMRFESVAKLEDVIQQIVSKCN